MREEGEQSKEKSRKRKKLCMMAFICGPSMERWRQVIFNYIGKREANLGYTVSTIPLEGLTICKCGVIIK